MNEGECRIGDAEYVEGERERERDEGGSSDDEVENDNYSSMDSSQDAQERVRASVDDPNSFRSFIRKQRIVHSSSVDSSVDSSVHNNISNRSKSDNEFSISIVSRRDPHTRPKKGRQGIIESKRSSGSVSGLTADEVSSDYFRRQEQLQCLYMQDQHRRRLEQKTLQLERQLEAQATIQAQLLARIRPLPQPRKHHLLPISRQNQEQSEFLCEKIGSDVYREELTPQEENEQLKPQNSLNPFEDDDSDFSELLVSDSFAERTGEDPVREENDYDEEAALMHNGINEEKDGDEVKAPSYPPPPPPPTTL